jgi:hypothetical protein
MAISLAKPYVAAPSASLAGKPMGAQPFVENSAGKTRTSQFASYDLYLKCKRIIVCKLLNKFYICSERF